MMLLLEVLIRGGLLLSLIYGINTIKKEDLKDLFK